VTSGGLAESLAGCQRKRAYKRKRNGDAKLCQSSDCRVVPEAMGNHRDRAIGGEKGAGKDGRRRELGRNGKPVSKAARRNSSFE